MMNRRDQFLIIKNYIDEISLDSAQEHFEYDHFLFVQNILKDFSQDEQDDFGKEVLTWSDHQMYIIARFFSTTGFKLKGKYDSGFVFCKCFSKIDDAGYLIDLAQNLEIQWICCKNKSELEVSDIIGHLYSVISNIKDASWIDHYFKIISNLK